MIDDSDDDHDRDDDDDVMIILLQLVLGKLLTKVSEWWRKSDWLSGCS